MEFCRIQPPQRSAAKEILSRLNIDGVRWPQIRKDLATAKLGILPTSLDDLSRFDWRMESEKAFQELQKIFEGTPSAEKLQSVFVHIRAVVLYLRQFGVHRQVYVNPLGTFNDRFYRGGIMFQCIFDTKKRHVFAAGGRLVVTIGHYLSVLLIFIPSDTTPLSMISDQNSVPSIIPPKFTPLAATWDGNSSALPWRTTLKRPRGWYQNPTQSMPPSPPMTTNPQAHPGLLVAVMS